MVSEAKLHLHFCWLTELDYGITPLLSSKETGRLLGSYWNYLFS